MRMITREDIHNLADIAWWLKGYLTAKAEDSCSCPFCQDHVDSLGKVIGNQKELVTEEEKTTNA